MSKITDEQFSQRTATAQLKIVEAKATLWVTLSFLAILAVIFGLAIAVALTFKAVLG